MARVNPPSSCGDRPAAVSPREIHALRALSGVLDVGFGLKERGGTLTPDHAWRVYVRRKLPADRLPSSHRVPRTIAGVATDVVEKTPTRRTAGTGAPPGSGARIANARGVPGTLGCVAVMAHDGRPVLLGSHHVLFGDGAGEREPVWRVDGGACRRLGNTLHGRLGTVAFDGGDCYVDCAVASLDGEAGVPPGWFAVPRAGRVAAARPGMRVTKTGGATGDTTGVIVDAEYPDVARIEGRTRHAPRQLLVRADPAATPFSAEGDSGAVLRDEAGRLVGQLWGVNARGESVASPIAPVLWVLGIHPARLAAPRTADRLAAARGP